MTKRKVSEADIALAVSEFEIQAALEDLAHIEDPALRAAFLSLIEEGLMVDTGHRKGGRILWATIGNVPKH